MGALLRAGLFVAKQIVPVIVGVVAVDQANRLIDRRRARAKRSR
jgi:hypothetical protein